MKRFAFGGLSEKRFDNEVARLRKKSRIKGKPKAAKLRKRDCTPMQWAAHLEYERVAYARRNGVTLREKKLIKVRTRSGIKTFDSLREAADHFRVNYYTAHWRKSRLGWTVEQALGQAPPPGRKATASHYKKKVVRVSIDGKTHTFESQSAAFRAFGIDVANGSRRLERGYTIRQALELDPPPLRKVRTKGTKTIIRLRGKRKVFPSLAAACRYFKVDPNNVYQQLGRGWSIEQAMGLEAPPRYDETAGGLIYLVTHRASGKQYVGLTRLSIEERWQLHCVQADESKRRTLTRPFINAIHEHGMDAFTVKQIDRAKSLGELNTKERYWIEKLNTIWPNGFNVTAGGSGPQRGKKVEWDGVIFESQKQLAVHVGINPVTLSSRFRKGASLEDALGLTDRYGPGRMPITVDGVSFPSKKSVADHYRVNYSTLCRRLKAGESIEEALDIAKTRPRVRKFANGPLSNRLEFAYHVDSNGCWVWKERVCGTTGLPIVRHEGKNSMASRLVYELLRQPIAESDLCIRTCENKLCINPDHMIIGSHADMHRIAGLAGKRKGENAYQAKVSASDVVVIRGFLNRFKGFRGRPGPKNFLARWYGVAVSSIRDIYEHRTWAHIP